MYVEKNGAGRYEVLIDSITLGSGETSIFDADGSAIVIHATADDNIADPVGNFGERPAQGQSQGNGGPLPANRCRIRELSPPRPGAVQVWLGRLPHLIDAKRMLLANQPSLAQAVNLQMGASIRLIKALGGGWDAGAGSSPLSREISYGLKFSKNDWIQVSWSLDICRRHVETSTLSSAVTILV